MKGLSMMHAGASVVALGILAVNALAYRHARSMLRFSSAREKTGKPETLSLVQKLKVLSSGVDLPRPRTSLSADVLGADARALQIPVAQGIVLGAWYAGAKPDRPLVILFHGYASEKSTLLPEASAFLGMGYSVLLVDFRGSGASSEAYTTIGVREGEDVVAAARFGREHLGHSRCVLYGQSMGAAAVLCAIARHRLEVDAIILESVFDRLSTTVKHRFEAMGLPSFPFAQLLLGWGSWQMGFNGFRHNPVEYARQVACPALLLHGAADPRARVEEARGVYSAIPGQRVMWEFADLGHASSIEVFPEDWKRVVTGFLAKIPNL